LLFMTVLRTAAQYVCYSEKISSELCFDKKDAPNDLRLRLTAIHHFLESYRSFLVTTLERDGSVVQRARPASEERTVRHLLSLFHYKPPGKFYGHALVDRMRIENS
jgi:hypothetical protein